MSNETADSGANNEAGDSGLCLEGEQENAQCNQSGSPEKEVVEKMDTNLNQPTIAKDSQGK